MAASTLPIIQTNACTSGIGKLEQEIKLLQAIAQLEADYVSATFNLPVTPDAINARACTSGIGKEMDPIKLLQFIAQLLNDQQP